MARKPMAPAGLGRDAPIPPPPARRTAPPPRPEPSASPSPQVDAATPTPTPAVSPPSAVELPTNLAAAPSLPAPAPKARTQVAPRRRAHSYADDISVPVTLSLPTALIEWIRNQRSTDQTVADVVLVAIAERLKELPDLVAELRNSKGRKEGAFTLSAPRSESVIGTLQMHTRSSNVDEIDRLVIECAAENRSQLVRAALEAAAA